jgi:hypothetical protein
VADALPLSLNVTRLLLICSGFYDQLRAPGGSQITITVSASTGTTTDRRFSSEVKVRRSKIGTDLAYLLTELMDPLLKNLGLPKPDFETLAENARRQHDGLGLSASATLGNKSSASNAATTIPLGRRPKKAITTKGTGKKGKKPQP